MSAQKLLEIRNRMLGVVEDRCGKRGVSPATREHIEEMIERAGAARAEGRDPASNRAEGVPPEKTAPGPPIGDPGALERFEIGAACRAFY